MGVVHLDTAEERNSCWQGWSESGLRMPEVREGREDKAAVSGFSSLPHLSPLYRPLLGARVGTPGKPTQEEELVTEWCGWCVARKQDRAEEGARLGCCLGVRPLLISLRVPKTGGPSRASRFRARVPGL